MNATKKKRRQEIRDRQYANQLANHKAKAYAPYKGKINK